MEEASLSLSLSTTTNTNTNDLIANYYLQQWRLKSKSAAAKFESMGFPEPQFLTQIDEDEEDDKEELPSELDTLNSSGGFSIVGPDKLSVRYPSVNHHGHDVGVVQANRPAPSKRLVYYFEMYVENAGAKGQVAIGFTTPGFRLRRQPGYPNVNHHGHDIGVVQANRPEPSKRLVYYFEMYVQNAGAEAQVAIGFTAPGFILRRQPGYFCFLGL
ncbi:putative protein MID1-COMPLEMENTING ACTIVITY 1-like isoform X1 [Capsicum annuum]|nr:putative protein MID1-COMPLEMENTING ACTIVITY 1-like isoform X1 [Capsicum annuum]